MLQIIEAQIEVLQIHQVLQAVYVCNLVVVEVEVDKSLRKRGEAFDVSDTVLAETEFLHLREAFELEGANGGDAQVD